MGDIRDNGDIQECQEHSSITINDSNSPVTQSPFKDEDLITALAESLSKHGFGGLTSEKLVTDFLENM